MRTEPMILAIDFDGVIHDHLKPLEGKKMGAPLPGAVEAMNALVDRGFKVYIYTVKALNESGAQAVVDWCEFYDVPHHGVVSTKPNADIYIDDKALHHLTWHMTMREIENRLGVKIDD